MKNKYKTELEGMQDFYEELGITPDYECNTDGRVEGTLVEFKPNTHEIPHSQFKKYLKSYNAIAKLIPRYSLFININYQEFVFMENSTNSKNELILKIITKGKWKVPQDLLKFLDKKEYIKGWIEEYSLIKYSDNYFTQFPSATKDDFIKEIGNPKVLNIKSYQWNKTGDMERDLLDCIGSKALKKRLGAFFTPKEYVKISTEYVRNAIKRVPKGYDYIILDLCAGTGNLQRDFTKEELSHCILNTLVYAEWTTLKGLYDDRVRCIIPHTKDYKDPDGLLSDGDALTEEFDKIITKIIEDERKKAGGKLKVIGLENPPYHTPQAEGIRGKKSIKQSSWVKEQMKKSNDVKGQAMVELANQFIYSMMNYADEYIIYAPIKYWKSQHLFDGKFNEGYLCNRRHFHTTSDASISLISWTIDKKNNNKKNNYLNMESDLGKRKIKKIYKRINSILPKKPKKGFATLCDISGTPDYKNGYLRNTNIINKGYRILLNTKNVLLSLPLFVANCYKPKDYTEKEVIMKSGDGGTKYLKSKNFLEDCFVWACLTNNNKCISNKQIKNELCLSQNTKVDKLLNVNNRNSKLLQKWQEILDFIKTTKEYHKKFKYGLHQICKEINIKEEVGRNKKNEPIMEHKYPDLNNLIKELKEQLKEFYNRHLKEKLFKYELLK